MGLSCSSAYKCIASSNNNYIVRFPSSWTASKLCPDQIISVGSSQPLCEINTKFGPPPQILHSRQTMKACLIIENKQGKPKRNTSSCFIAPIQYSLVIYIIWSLPHKEHGFHAGLSVSLPKFWGQFEKYSAFQRLVQNQDRTSRWAKKDTCGPWAIMVWFLVWSFGR